VRGSTLDPPAAFGSAPNPPQSGHALDDTLSAPSGDPLAYLTPLVYAQLRAIARRQRRYERADLTLSTTDLVHDGYVRLAAGSGLAAGDERQLLAAASVAMRRVLIEHARRHHALKRGGALQRVSLDEATLAAAGVSDRLLALDEALGRLTVLDARLAHVVECRYFGGLTEDETAAALGVTARTVRRDWVKAKGWLFRELHDVGS
jgi:RNA polymerase sigma factor (TIGR02999 family)